MCVCTYILYVYVCIHTCKVHYNYMYDCFVVMSVFCREPAHSSPLGVLARAWRYDSLLVCSIACDMLE